MQFFFKKLSKQSFYRIINEKSKLVKFKPGQLVLPIHHRSPWNNELFNKYAAKQMSVLEQLDLKNDIGQGGMTVLSVEGKNKRRTSELRQMDLMGGGGVGKGLIGWLAGVGVGGRDELRT